MDVTTSEIEMSTKSDTIVITKNGNEGVVNSCPVRSFSVDGTITNDYLYKKSYSYDRQNSINDSREYNEIKDKKNLANFITNIGVHNTTLNTAQTDGSQDKLAIKSSYVRQISNISAATQGLLEKNTSVPNDKKMTEHVLIGNGHHMKREYSDDQTWIGKRYWGNGANIYKCMSGCSCALSVISVAFVLLIFLKITYFPEEQRERIVASTRLSQKTTSEVNTAGSFKLNQTHLQEYKRVVWLKDENSEIIPSKVDDCLSVPYGGKYLVISRFTFKLLPHDDVASLTHIFKVKTSTGIVKDGGYKRKYVSVLENKLRTGAEVSTYRELRKPSVFIEFFDLDAYDQICPNVSSPALLYQSRLDNDVNIIKV